MARRGVRTAGGLLVGAAWVLLGAPAAAHGGGSPGGSAYQNYTVSITMLGETVTATRHTLLGALAGAFQGAVRTFGGSFRDVFGAPVTHSDMAAYGLTCAGGTAAIGIGHGYTGCGRVTVRVPPARVMVRRRAPLRRGSRQPAGAPPASWLQHPSPSAQHPPPSSPPACPPIVTDTPWTLAGPPAPACMPNPPLSAIDGVPVFPPQLPPALVQQGVPVGQVLPGPGWTIDQRWQIIQDRTPETVCSGTGSHRPCSTACVVTDTVRHRQYAEVYDPDRCPYPIPVP